jgi:hypothetical protein
VANIQNLKPGEYKFTHDDQIAGGIASGKARAERATMKKTLEAMLKQKNDKGITYQELSTLGLIKGAVDGKAENYKVMLQLLGELEEQEQIGTPQVNINIVDHSDLEKALYEDEND